MVGSSDNEGVGWTMCGVRRGGAVEQVAMAGEQRSTDSATDERLPRELREADWEERAGRAQRIRRERDATGLPALVVFLREEGLRWEGPRQGVARALMAGMVSGLGALGVAGMIVVGLVLATVAVAILGSPIFCLWEKAINHAVRGLMFIGFLIAAIALFPSWVVLGRYLRLRGETPGQGMWLLGVMMACPVAMVFAAMLAGGGSIGDYLVALAGGVILIGLALLPSKSRMLESFSAKDGLPGADVLLPMGLIAGGLVMDLVLLLGMRVDPGEMVLAVVLLSLAGRFLVGALLRFDGVQAAVASADGSGWQRLIRDVLMEGLFPGNVIARAACAAFVRHALMAIERITAESAPVASTSVCPDCLARPTPHEDEAIGASYYRCRVCGQIWDATHFVPDVQGIVGVLSRGWQDRMRAEDSLLLVNAMQVGAQADYDRIEIRDAGDVDVERFVIAIRNDTDEFRRGRARSLGCHVAANCGISTQSRRMLEGTFGRVEMACAGGARAQA